MVWNRTSSVIGLAPRIHVPTTRFGFVGIDHDTWPAKANPRREGDRATQCLHAVDGGMKVDDIDREGTRRREPHPPAGTPLSGSMLRFAAHPVRAHSTGLPCSTNWFSLFPPENSLFDQINSLFRGVGNSKLKPHDISGLGGLDPAYSRPNPRNSLFFPCKTGKSGQRRVRSRLRPPPRPYIFLILLRFLWISSPFSAQIPGACRCSGEGLRLAETLLRGVGVPFSHARLSSPF